MVFQIGEKNWLNFYKIQIGKNTKKEQFLIDTKMCQLKTVLFKHQVFQLPFPQEIDLYKVCSNTPLT